MSYGLSFLQLAQPTVFFLTDGAGALENRGWGSTTKVLETSRRPKKEAGDLLQTLGYETLSSTSCVGAS
jgi:hypothetical protein